VAGLIEVPDECRRRSAALIDGMSSYQPRRPAGAPTGGQFATKTCPEPGYALTDDGPGPATIDGRPAEHKVSALGDGGRTEWYFRDGHLQDPDDGRPAVVSYYPDGTVRSEDHFRDDKRHDPADGRPAAVWYRQDGTVAREDHYRAGRAQDPDDGRPAVTRYRPDGTVEHEAHYRSGHLQDPDDGRPARVWYRQDGTVEYKEHRRPRKRQR